MTICEHMRTFVKVLDMWRHVWNAHHKTTYNFRDDEPLSPKHTLDIIGLHTHCGNSQVDDNIVILVWVHDDLEPFSVHVTWVRNTKQSLRPSIAFHSWPPETSFEVVNQYESGCCMQLFKDDEQWWTGQHFLLYCGSKKIKKLLIWKLPLTEEFLRSTEQLCWSTASQFF